MARNYIYYEKILKSVEIKGDMVRPFQKQLDEFLAGHQNIRILHIIDRGGGCYTLIYEEKKEIPNVQDKGNKKTKR